MKIYFKTIESPLGLLNTCAIDEGVCWLDFADKPTADKRLKTLEKRLKANLVNEENSHLKELTSQLNEFFEGKRKEFTVKVSTEGTIFQKKVWSALQRIPYAKTLSYKEQAEAIGMSSAVRAVANANGMNPISILIPCHRVIGSNGQLTGYGGGLWRKKFLLDLETTYNL